MKWLLLEIMAFFFNFVSLVVFMLITRHKKYLTIRERIGLAYESGPRCRKESDYLEYCSSDLQYFSDIFTVVSLVFFAGYWNLEAYQSKAINISFGICFSRHVGYVFLLVKFFFNRKIKATNFIDYCILAYIFVTNFMMMVVYFKWQYNQSTIWSEAIIVDVVFSTLFLA